MKNLTIEEMQKIAIERNGICLSNIYINCSIKIKWRCVYGHEWFATPNSVKYGSWCPICNNTLLSIEEMQLIAKEKGGECLSNEYINSHTKLKWRCNKGHEWLAVPYPIKNGIWCPNCSDISLSIEEMKNIAKERDGECLSTNYINNKTKLEWKCSEGHKWFAVPNHIKEGGWCPICAKISSTTIEDIKKLAIERGGKCLSNHYENNNIKLKWKCCEGHEWFAILNSVKNNNTWCPICRESKGENMIRLFLNKNNIKYIKEKKFDNCKNIRRLSFDFYLPKHNMLIEYDGKQHQMSCQYYGGEIGLKIRQKRDKIKNEYCKTNNIKLIRISVYDKDVNAILKNYLNL